MSEPVTSSSEPIHDPDVPEGRKISVLVWVAIAIVYLAIVHLLGEVGKSQLDEGVEYGTFPDTETLWWALIMPVGASAVFAAIVTTILGWWPQVMRDHRPVQRWVRIIPIIMVVTILIGINYADLFDTSVGFVVLFLIGALMVGFAEELMFRGLGVTVFRAKGFSEKRVALWVAIAFGAAHSINLFTQGATALLQVLVTMAAGYFLYLVLRVTGSLAAAMVVHGLWDFGLFTGLITEDVYALGALFVLADIVMAIILLVRRHHIEPETPTAATAMG